MARLNDAAAPIDPVELLRRKYSRQNKEIARVNSTQCVRIRNLENEVSRLLAENLGLHERILRLQSEADSSHAQRIVEQVTITKSSLEAKLLELTALVTSLGDEPVLLGRLSAKAIEDRQASPTDSPDRRNWKNMCALSEAAGLQDIRLPPILEDKSYPRVTLDPTEIVDMLSGPMADNTESPDIGPPPVSKFINEEPVKIDLPCRTEVEIEEPTCIDPTRSVNLEQRRKRRDSTVPSERKRPSRFEPKSNQAGKDLAQSLKTGAKRKLSNRDEDDKVSNTKVIETSPDDFTYRRRSAADQFQAKTVIETEKKGSNTIRDFVVAREAAVDRPGLSISANGRKALGPKSTNTDVVNSPKKTVKPTTADDLTFEKRVLIRRDQSRERGRERRNEYAAHESTIEPMAPDIEINGQSEMSVSPGLFSPPLSDSSAVYAESRDTPPPSELGPGSDGHRPSRRTKGSVSYAEPNLRDKMRRPTKELVDAVTGKRKAQRLSAVELEQDPVITVPKIKEEVETDDSWKNIPPVALLEVYSKSPLGYTPAARDSVVETAATEQQRRFSIHLSTDSELNKSSSGPATSAVHGGSRKSSQGPHKESEQKKVSPNEAISRLDVYEFTGSSPRERNDSKILTVKTEWATLKPTRQSSSLMHESGQARRDESSDGESNERPLSTLSRRRQWMTEMGASVSSMEAEDQNAGQGMRRSNSHSLSSKGRERSSRSDRLSARRRSMIL